MTGPIIPAGQWPEGAASLVWSAAGLGKWVTADSFTGTWEVALAGVPMPAGHDWRVPVMRPNPAKAIDLGQYAVAVQYAINGMREAGCITNTQVADKLESLLALIDRQACNHPDDRAVEAFAAAMKAKLAASRAKGRAGWNGDEPGMQPRLSDMLREHVAKGDPVDVANFAMFLHQRGERIDGPAAIDLEQFRHAVEFWRRNCEMPHLETEASRLLALIDGQAGPDTIGDALSAMGNAYPLTDAGMQAALDGDQPTKGEGE